jgi:rare lipoprotein A
MRFLFISTVVLFLVACGGGTGGYYKNDGPPGGYRDVSNVPDATPRNEPLCQSCSRPYTVHGKRYIPTARAAGYTERGEASWYGRRYHGRQTSNGERYDMYKMSGAHPTLPLPSYVEVTNLRNGRKVVVRLNDRGPFLQGRVIDLSYAAAARLEMLGSGTSPVEIREVSANSSSMTTGNYPVNGNNNYEAIISEPLSDVPVGLPQTEPQPGSPPVSAPPTSAGGLYIQVGAYSKIENAQSVQRKLLQQGFYAVTLSPMTRSDGVSLQRIWVGPMTPAAISGSVAKLRGLGYQTRVVE